MNIIPVCAEEFITFRNQLSTSLRAYVNTYTVEECAHMQATLYLSCDKQSGFGITADGCLISLFSLVRGRGTELVHAAIARGAHHLDCLGDHLRTLYENAGFTVTTRLEWNDAHAPSGWDYERFGCPNYYEMSLSGLS